MESLNQILSNVNVNKTKTNNVNNVKYKAQTLAERLGDDHSFEFYCKVAWQLPESVIERNLESALKGREPRKLFTWLCKQQLTN